VLAAAGHRRTARPTNPAGLTAREVKVLGLLAIGLTTREIADQLVISAKTADHHGPHIYAQNRRLDAGCGIAVRDRARPRRAHGGTDYVVIAAAGLCDRGEWRSAGSAR
jgi:DNA-binding CsgD family transcriptional regulator